jgi:hypothetical protein
MTDQNMPSVAQKRSDSFPFDPKDDHRNPRLDRWRNRCNYLRYGGAKKWVQAFFKYMRGVAGNFSLLVPLLVLISIAIVFAITIKVWLGNTNPFLYALLTAMALILVFSVSFFLSEIPTSRANPSVKRESQPGLSFLIWMLPAAVVLDVLPIIIRYLRHKEFLTDSFNWNSIIQYSFTLVFVYGTTIMLAIKALAGTQSKSNLVVQMIALVASWFIVVASIIWMVNRIYYGIPPTGFSLLLPFLAAFALFFCFSYQFIPKTRCWCVTAILISAFMASILTKYYLMDYSLWIVRCSKQIGELTRPITNITNAIKEDKESLRKSLSTNSMSKLESLIQKRESLSYSNQLTWKEHFDSDYSDLTRQLEKLTPFLAENVNKKLLSMSAESNELQDWSVFTTIRPKYYASAMNYLEEFGSIDGFSQGERQRIRESESLYAANKLVSQIEHAYNYPTVPTSSNVGIENLERRSKRMLLIGKLIEAFYTKDQDIPLRPNEGMIDKLATLTSNHFSEKSSEEIVREIREQFMGCKHPQKIEIRASGKRAYFERLIAKLQTDKPNPIREKIAACIEERLSNNRDLNSSNVELTPDSRLVIEAFGEFLGIVLIREQGNRLICDRINSCLNNATTNKSFVEICSSDSVDAFAVSRNCNLLWNSLSERTDSFLVAVLGNILLAETNQEQIHASEGRAEGRPTQLLCEILYENINLVATDKYDAFLIGLHNKTKQERRDISNVCEFILTHRAIAGKLEVDPSEYRTTSTFRELFVPTIPNSKKITEANAHVNERAMILFQRAFSDQKAVSAKGKERLLLLTLCDPISTRMDRLLRNLFCGAYADLVNTRSPVDQLALSMLSPNLITVISPAVILFVFGAIFVNPNLTSLHEFYKDSLVQAFFMPYSGTSSDLSKTTSYRDIKVSDLYDEDKENIAPIALINATLNAPGSRDEGLRERNAYLFFFTPSHMGAVLPLKSNYGVDSNTQRSFIKMEDYEMFDPSFTLGNAMTISAGAAAPNMGRYSNWMFRLAMLFLNVRLGYWIWQPTRIPMKSRSKVESFRLKEVIDDEEKLVEKRRSVVRYKKNGPSADTPSFGDIGFSLIGLAFSGGGIRSAAFNMGIAQSTKSCGLWDSFDYLSTVSGGGYIGCSLQILLSDISERPEPGSGVSTQPNGQNDTDKSIAESKTGQEIPKTKPGESKDDSTEGNSLFDRLFFNRKYFCIFAEAFALMDTKHGWWNLSDGGHIENLGVYSLLLRRCKIIVVGDGEDDHRGIFDGLTRLLLLAQNDLGVTIEFVDGQLSGLSGVDGFAKTHFTVGKIKYAPNKSNSAGDDKTSSGDDKTDTGWLLYLRASVTGDEDAIISNYRKGNERFPNETTADQFFDEHQFEAYRLLGLHIGQVAFKTVLNGKSMNDFVGEDPCDVLSGHLERYFDILKSRVVSDDRFMIPWTEFPSLVPAETKKVDPS